jgi:hypothetical protein
MMLSHLQLGLVEIAFSIRNLSASILATAQRVRQSGMYSTIRSLEHIVVLASFYVRHFPRHICTASEDSEEKCYVKKTGQQNPIPLQSISYTRET